MLTPIFAHKALETTLRQQISAGLSPEDAGAAILLLTICTAYETEHPQEFISAIQAGLAKATPELVAKCMVSVQ